MTRPRDDLATDRTRGGVLEAGGCSRSHTVTAKVSAIASIIENVGFATPVSIRDMYVRKTPTVSAKSSWVMPRRARTSLIRKPSAAWGESRFTQR